MWALLLSSCVGFERTPNVTDKPLYTAPHTTAFYAHRGGSGYWPQNSRLAVRSLVERFSASASNSGFQGIEVDIVLSKDKIPLLAHDPWVSPKYCQYSDGRKIENRYLIKDLSFSQLEKQFTCGGSTDPDFSGAVRHAESMMSLAELFTWLKSVPELGIFLDLKIQPPLTATAAQYAKAINGAWHQAKLGNKLIVEGPDRASLRAYRRFLHMPYTPALSYPPFLADANWLKTGAKTLVKTRWRADRAARKARRAKAGAIVSPALIYQQSTVDHLRQQSTLAVAFTASDANQEDVDALCHSGVDIIIVDYPGKLSCEGRAGKP